jgi:peptide/nickel transport system substrate-binding protein
MRRALLLAVSLAPFLAPAATLAAVSEAGVVTLAIEADLRTFDPRFAVDANSQYVENLLHCSLIDFDREGRTVPDLAKSWTWDNPTSLTIDLNPAKFSDGTSVTAEDVRATYMYFKDEKAKDPSPRKGAFANLKNVTVKDPAKVTFELAEADSTFVLNLVIGILPAKVASGAMVTEKDAVPGCGPFTLKGVSSAGVELAANPTYSLGSKPKLKGVLIKIVKDENTRYAKLQAGELDLVQNLLNRDKLNDIAKANPALTIVKRPGLNTSYLGFNMRDKVVGNVLVRQAIAQAIDKQKIIKYVLNGMAIPADTLITPSDPFHSSKVKAPAFDPEAAKKLLDQAGFKQDGKKPRFTLSYKTTTDLTRVAVAKAIASDLKKIGIDVNVETLEWGRFKADVEAGKVQMWSLSWIGFKDPDIYRFAFGTESFPPNGGNRGWYSNPELDKLLTAARAETDPKKRAASYEKVQQIVATEQPYVFLWHEEIFAVVNKKVSGFEVYADGRYGALLTAEKK